MEEKVMWSDESRFTLFRSDGVSIEAAMADYKHCLIEKWTKEHVHAWLCETVKVKQKYADMFIEQEVSGECLLCFEKQDILDMGIEHGPAIKIWSQLKKHKTLSDTEASSKQETPVKTSHTTEADVSTKTKRPQRQPIPRERRGNQMANIFTLLLNCLEDLSKEDFKKFRRYLQDAILNEGNTIPTSHLENKERTDIASLIIEYHGEETALKTTICVLEKIPRNDLVENLQNVDELQVTTIDSKRKETRETDQGEKLKNLLTCGASTLGHYSHFIVITNQSDPGQLQHLHFLCKLNLFCVLDFDPNSNMNGICKLYRESRHANLHFPALFQGEPSAVIKNLNLYKQTSWVFCNGRLDLDSESSRPLDYQSWLRITHREIEQMVSFIFRPEVLPSRRWLVIFLLLSPVESEKDPIFDTFMTFHRQCGGEENIIHICKDEDTFQNWQNLIRKKYEFDLDKQSIHKLDLSQINGLIMKLGPHSQSCKKLLASADSSYVILQPKDSDRMTTLDILCANECETVQVENSSEFQNLKLEVEEEFYRGGGVSWLNLYFSEKQNAKPFIKRDKYEAVMAMVTSQVKRHQSPCVLVNLFHHPGCGATTLAKHVMWDLRSKLRCAVLRDSSSDEQVASQITDLMKIGKSDESPQTPVLLLVDNSRDTEAAEKLKNCVRRKLDENCLSKKGKDTSSLVIILNCVRTHFPKDQYRRCEDSQYITAELTKKEQDDFEEKLQELKENHKRPENFYSFMIMKSNFDKRYVKNVVSNILFDVDIGTNQTRLLSFMALLNSYIASSDIPQSVCEDFLGMKTFLWGKETVLDRMEPYSNLLIGSKGGQYGEYPAIRILHHDIACACLEELDSTYNMKSGDIVMDLLHCDLFFKSGPGKDALTLSIQRMLIERQRNVKNERNSQFSLLIEKVHKDEGRQKVTDIFMKASTRYEKSASIPQALARYLYLYYRDFSQALVWAERATKITENPFTVDTIGQIYKNDLKYKIQQEKEQEIARTPECLDVYLEIAKKAVNAFQRAQKLAKTEYEPYEDNHLTKDSYNQSADMGIEAAMADYKHLLIEKWTKEHVHAWLCETVKVKLKYADMFIEQEVSGECLLYFEKQDILDMGIEHGPGVKIWSQLKKHKTLSDTEASSKQETPVKTSHPTEADASTKTERTQPQPIPREDGDIQIPNIFTLLSNCLEDLSEEHFKKFKRYLKEPILNKGNTIPTSQLENKDRTDIVDLIREYHGEETGLKTTICILEKIPRNDLVERLKKDVDQLQATTTDSKRDEARETDQGEKLKNLLTCGASMLGHYSHFIVITNQSDPDQLQHLHFLCKLNLFCVLDFDPNSNTNGTCKTYGESRHANLHFPALFQGEPSAVIKNLSLNNQTSWVFCNGRLDLDSESSKPLDYQSWLRRTHREIEQMVSFIFRPEVLLSRRWLVIFLLLSPVESEKDPIFDTFMTFHRQCGGEENIIHICKNEHTFQNWQNLIRKKYEFNLNKQSIYKLDLSQVNGRIMKLGPHSQPCEKLLPSADSSYVILQQKVCDRMTTLDILCANECENVHFENSSEFQIKKLEAEEEFYRGGEVKWLNFYFSEKQKAKPFIKRDKYEAVMAMVTSQVKRPQSTCVLVNLFHHPGCGATTLAKHVMWDLRNQLRCAVLKESSSDEQVALQITDLIKIGKSDESPQTPVLLLVDNSRDTEAAEKLKNCVRRKLDENCPSKKGKDTSSLVIILNCVRTHFPKDQYKRCEDSQYITAELTKKEQDDFEEKLQELKKKHKKPENFYSFMFMKSNFDKKYVKNLVRNILIDLDIGTKEARLLSIMALLNSYIASSDIPQSVCEVFLGMKAFLLGEDTVLDRMEPYSNLLIGSKGGRYMEYSVVRILHHDIACACLEELDSTYNMKSGDIVMDLLHCDLFFKSGPGKDALTLSIHRMLIERQRNVKTERNSQFSLLIEKVHKDEGRQKVTDIFLKASTRYEKSASIPQALARYLYLYHRDFSQALVWAERATKISENSFTVDTIGQIYKKYLKYKIQQEKEQEIAHTPECLDIYLELAKKAVNAFQRAQKLAKTEYESCEDNQLTKDSYNQSADMGLEHPHTVPADGAVGVEVEGHQVFWTCDYRRSILVLTTVPPHTDSLGVSTKTKAGLVTEDDPLPF
ncbi:hypothetical protein NFI96_000967 [Prochilodus magdalenae]|nr:hypothetical protein NFI96_000967 [Prochilodus magdalenae]